MSNAKFDCGMKRMRTRAAAARMALLTSTALCLSFAAPATVLAQSDVETDTSEQGKEFNIPPSDMGKALDAYAEQADVEIIYSDRDVAGKLSNGVHGTYPRDAALDELIGSSGLKYTINDDGVIVIQAASLEVKEAAAERPMMRVAEVATEEKAETSGYEAGGAERERDKVVVTGTRIKGVKDQFSPVTQVSRDEMDLAGFANVADAVEAIPQNFGGDASVDTSIAGPGRGPGGASVNLRGLGNQATLILLNGRRMAAGGGAGNFVDISAIPTSAIDRVEVLTDGASAIYGSDAIGGVVNIILRDDFDGGETRLNVGTITDGGGDYLKAAQTFGLSSDRAHAMVTYEFSNEEELKSNQKRFSESVVQPTWLLPFTQKNSVFASTGAQLIDAIKISADGYFNNRKSKQFTSTALTGLRQEFSTLTAQQYGGAVGIDIALSHDWEANLSGSYSGSDQSNDAQRINAGTNEINTTKTDVMSFDGSLGGSLFNIASDPVRAIAGVHYRTEEVALLRNTSLSGVLQDFDKSRNVFAAFGEIYVPIVSKGKGGLGLESLALSAALRYEDYTDMGSSFDPRVALAWSPVNVLSIRGSYSTSFRAPRLDQQVDLINLAALRLYVDALGDEHTVLIVGGDRDDLSPEKSTTWTIGFDLAPPSIEGLLIRGTYFDTDYIDQVGSPGLETDNLLRAINFTGIPVSITTEEALDLCARASTCVNFGDFSSIFPQFEGLSFDDVELLIDGRRQNLASSKAAGFDIEGSYDFSSATGNWRFVIGGTLLTTFEKLAAPAAVIDDQLNTFSNPVDLKVRGGIHLNTGALASGVFVNHIGDYIDDEVPAGDLPIASFTTVDATLRIDLGEFGDSPLADGASFSVSIINMFNEDPPFITATPTRLLTSTTFDAANANPAGRKIGILLTKRW